MDPLTERLERVERLARENRVGLTRIRTEARRVGVRGLRYFLIVALAVISPKDAIKQLLAYVDGDCSRDEDVAGETEL
jgi:hypothetical protein